MITPTFVYDVPNHGDGVFLSMKDWDEITSFPGIKELLTPPPPAEPGFTLTIQNEDGQDQADSGANPGHRGGPRKVF